MFASDQIHTINVQLGTLDGSSTKLKGFVYFSTNLNNMLTDVAWSNLINEIFRRIEYFSWSLYFYITFKDSWFILYKHVKFKILGPIIILVIYSSFPRMIKRTTQHSAVLDCTRAKFRLTISLIHANMLA